MSNSLKARWKDGSAWYAARPKREKIILAVAGLAVVWAIADALWLTPSGRLLKEQAAAEAQKTSELATLESQRVALKEMQRAREAELKRETESSRNQLASIAGQLAEFDRTLVPARLMADFLRSLLPGSGVEVVALRTLPPTPLIVRAAPKAVAKEGATEPAAAGEKPEANIYRHGVEITLAGNYDALLAYLTRIEQAPQKVLWGRLELKAEKHPRNELTLVIYTLSLDPSWLVV